MASVMHPGQVEVSVDAVARAIEDQVPELAGLRIERVPSAGTEVAPFRVGEAFVARVPLVPRADADARVRLRAAAEHALFLTRRIPVEVPRPIAVGEPWDDYPGLWSLWTWVDGDSLDAAPRLDQQSLAGDLAALANAFHALPIGADWTHNGRGGRPLADTDWVRTSIARTAHLIDAVAATAVWERALAAEPHAGPALHLSSDAVPGNLIVRDGRLAGLIDIGAPMFGDPASDLAPAWSVLDEPARSAFRHLTKLDAAAWERGRGWAFEMAIGGLHYYEHTNQTFVEMARRTLARLLETA